jgi:transposase
LRLASESRSTQVAAQQLGISPQLLYRWQQAQLMAEVGSVEAARDPEARQLRAQPKRAKQELDILKKPWASLANQPGAHLPLHRSAPVRQLCQTLRLVIALPKPLPGQHFALLGEALPPS